MSQVSVIDPNGGYHGGYRGESASARFQLPMNRDLRVTKTITLNEGDARKKKEEIRHYFHNTFEIYERLYECLNSDESYTIQPIHKIRHPLIFYLGHTACFYINKLVCAGLTTRINPRYEEMFAVGVDEMSWDDLNPGHYNWPTVEEVWKYRVAARERVDELFKQHTLSLPLNFLNSTCDRNNSFFWCVMMGIEHERIHLETASVHVRELPLRLVKKHSFWGPCTETGTAPTNELVAVSGGEVSLGRAFDSPAYGWDCDYTTGLRVTVAPFKASKYLATNAEFLEFINAGGYFNEKYWDEEGWRYVSWKKPTHPWFWVRRDGAYYLRVQVEEIPLPMDWPVELNSLEARAFCNFLSEKTGQLVRLPTEAEWMLLHDQNVKDDQWEWEAAPGNINMEYFASSCPVTRFKQGQFYDIVGNAWQHCETPVYPYPGYKTHPFYDDFSMPTFDGRHYCMKGGAWVSTGNEATRDARYAFRRHFFQDIGVRYVVGEPVDEKKLLQNVVGMDPEVDDLAAVAFGASIHPAFGNFPHQLSQHVLEVCAKHFGGTDALASLRAMDLLCGAGRLTFELSPFFADVVGVDVSARRLQPAFSMKERGVVSYSVLNADNGQRSAEVATVASYSFGAHRDKVNFYQADPSNLHQHLDKFDVIVAWNVLENTYKPSAIIPHLVTRLKPNGLILLASSYSFTESVAPREFWTCKKDTASMTTTLDWIEANCATSLRLVGDTKDLVGIFAKDNRNGEVRKFQVSSWVKL